MSTSWNLLFVHVPFPNFSAETVFIVTWKLFKLYENFIFFHFSHAHKKESPHGSIAVMGKNGIYVFSFSHPLLLWYSHWMSNLQPSSSASEGDIWLYALHDKYFPASERLSVIDNVLVVWFPSLDVWGARRGK